jgi:drug/metabolite transporter (DMT)-like permease
MITYVVAAFCVLGLAIGQILFKLSAASLQRTESFFNPSTIVTLVSAFTIYGVTTIVWIWVLQKIELGRVYPLMALAFILVPIGSYIFFGERFKPQYFIGIAMIMAGIIIAVKA